MVEDKGGWGAALSLAVAPPFLRTPEPKKHEAMLNMR